MTSLSIPKSILSSKIAHMLALEKDIVLKKFRYSRRFFYKCEESQKRTFVPRFLISCLATDEKADIPFNTAGNKTQWLFNYLHIASSLCVSDRLQTFWKYVLLYLTLPTAKFWPGNPFIFRHLQIVISTREINQNFMSFCLVQANSTKITSEMSNTIQYLRTLLLK